MIAFSDRKCKGADGPGAEKAARDVAARPRLLFSGEFDNEW
jgi:hypothetical protein